MEAMEWLLCIAVSGIFLLFLTRSDPIEAASEEIYVGNLFLGKQRCNFWQTLKKLGI